MSTTSSSQMPIQDGQSNQLQPHVVRKKSNSSSFLYSEDNLREETILEKQVVRITPPLYVDSKRLLFEKRIRNGYAYSGNKFIVPVSFFFCFFLYYFFLYFIICILYFAFCNVHTNEWLSHVGVAVVFLCEQLLLVTLCIFLVIFQFSINSSSSYAQTTPTKTTPINKLTHSVDEHNFITRLTPLLLGVDKECQTDDIPQISNMDASREGSSNLCNVYAEVSHRNPEFVSIYYSSTFSIIFVKSRFFIYIYIYVHLLHKTDSYFNGYNRTFLIEVQSDLRTKKCLTFIYSHNFSCKYRNQTFSFNPSLKLQNQVRENGVLCTRNNYTSLISRDREFDYFLPPVL